MKKSLLSISGILVLAAIVLLVNGVAGRLFGRVYVDLTEESLYSLSDGSKRILSELKEPITLKYYFSKTEGARFPAIKLYGDRVYDLLREYERLGGGNIRLEFFDPRPDTEEEEWAQKYGLSPIPTPEGAELFLGLTGVNGLGDEQAIPVFNIARQEYLEYDLSKLISSLAKPKKPVIGILSSLDVQGAPQFGTPFGGGEGGAKWSFAAQLEERAEVRYLKPEITEIDKAIDVLMVVHPKEFAQGALFAIDQFVMAGGKLIVFQDPFCQADNPAPDPNNPMAGMMADRSSNLNKLLSKWGVEMLEGKVVSDLSYVTRVSTGQRETNFPLWLSLRKPSFDGEDMVTSKLESMLLPWAGALKSKSVEGVTVVPLLSSSKDSQLIEVSQIKMNGGDPEKLLQNFIPSGEEVALAMRITGKLKTNFPVPPDEVSAGTVLESKDSANIIVVSDVDMLTDRFSIVQQNFLGAQIVSLLNDNLNFTLNSAENLLGSNDLISIRSRGRFTREFTKIQELEVAAQQRWQQEEAVFQAKLNNANQRLNQLQSASGDGAKSVVTKEMLEEIRRFREEKKEAQANLRAVRRRLREDIERLENAHFLINTFLVPLILLLGASMYQILKRRGA